MTAAPNTPPSDSTPLIDTRMVVGPAAIEPFDSFPGDCGAEGVFLGRTRIEAHPQFGQLKYLEYEAYRPMCESLLSEMATHAARTFDCRAVRISHSTGRVDPGQASVVIQVATPHRGESFEAARYLIDRLKHELPIWKREHWEHGVTFVQGCCAHHPDDRQPVAPDAPWPPPHAHQPHAHQHPHSHATDPDQEHPRHDQQ